MRIFANDPPLYRRDPMSCTEVGEVLQSVPRR